MALQLPCWICDGRGERQITLRPGGIPDGRTVCRVCIRRLFTWLREPLATGDGAALAQVWPGIAVFAEFPEGEEWREDVRQAVKQRVTEQLPEVDDVTRASTALAFVEMGFLWDALEALATVTPDATEAEQLNDRTLTSLLSRLLSHELLAADASEQLHARLYSLR